MSKGRKKGMRRAYLKQFDSRVINGGQGVDKRYIDQFKNNSRSYGSVRSGPTIQLTDSGLPILPSLKHPDPLPKTRSHYTEAGSYVPGVVDPRLKVELKLREHKLAERMTLVDKFHVYWTDGHGQKHGVETFNRVTIVDGKISKIFLFFSANQFMFVEQKPWMIRRSYIYTDRSRAYRAYAEGKISWVEKLTPEKSDDKEVQMREVKDGSTV